jgi:hypothetical protein
MKRYGYKFEKLDGQMTEAIEIRYLSAFLAVVCGVFASIYTGEKSQIFSLVPISIIFIALSFGAEFFKRTFLTAIIGLCILFISVIIYLIATNFNECFKYCPDGEFRSKKDAEYLTPGMSICILLNALLYNCPIIYASIAALRR